MRAPASRDTSERTKKEQGEKEGGSCSSTHRALTVPAPRSFEFAHNDAKSTEDLDRSREKSRCGGARDISAVPTSDVGRTRRIIYRASVTTVRGGRGGGRGALPPGKKAPAGLARALSTTTHVSATKIDFILPRAKSDCARPTVAAPARS